MVSYRIDAIRRFMEKVSTSPEGCWEWTASTTVAGYGRFYMGDPTGRLELAHRAAHMFFIGPIPPGYQVDHLCRNIRCVNPRHLEAVTPRENLFRSRGFAPANAAKAQCPQGHPYDEANTYRYASGSRRCRTCSRLQARQRYQPRPRRARA